VIGRRPSRSQLGEGEARLRPRFLLYRDWRQTSRLYQVLLSMYTDGWGEAFTGDGTFLLRLR